MNIREANISDLDGLISLYNQLVTYQKLVNNHSFKETFNNIINFPNYYIIIAEENRKIIATCSIIILPNLTHHQRPYAIIENVVTDEKFRHMGYATALLNYAKEISIDNHCHKILVQTRSKEHETLNFYINNGFDKNETTGFQINFEEIENNG